jgi:heat-inducible transcriptional repressor
MEKEKVEYREIVKRLWNASAWAVVPGRAEVYIDGQSNILDYPEFAEDVRKMQTLLRAFEEKGILLQLLTKAMERGGVRVYIGHESQCDEMAECSLIVSNYCRGGVPLGTLGIIGPKRMDYSRVIPLVEFAAKAVGEKLEQIGG